MRFLRRINLNDHAVPEDEVVYLRPRLQIVLRRTRRKRMRMDIIPCGSNQSFARFFILSKILLVNIEQKTGRVSGRTVEISPSGFR